MATMQVIELDDNEAALSMCLASFGSHPEYGTCLVVGTAQGLTFYPRNAEGWCGKTLEIGLLVVAQQEWGVRSLERLAPPRW